MHRDELYVTTLDLDILIQNIGKKIISSIVNIYFENYFHFLIAHIEYQIIWHYCTKSDPYFKMWKYLCNIFEVTIISEYEVTWTWVLYEYDIKDGEENNIF